MQRGVADSFTSIFLFQFATIWNENSNLPPSSLKYNLIGLNLLCLLSQNRISDFHTALEQIEPEQLNNNPAIQHPVKLEQSLMEGSYNRVWSSRSVVPAPEYLFFIDILMDTIRNEIASCSEKAYTSLPLSDAGTLLFFTNMQDILNFAKEVCFFLSFLPKIGFRCERGHRAKHLLSSAVVIEKLEGQPSGAKSILPFG